jgi:chemotaxis protein MotB
MRRKRHEDHINHEAWAIPYGDLITLLLAFFVVMYSISSVNEGKYRVLSYALSEAFGGPAKTLKPIQVGQPDGASRDSSVLALAAAPTRNASAIPNPDADDASRPKPQSAATKGPGDLAVIGQQIQNALGDMIKNKLVSMRRTPTSLEVEITTDILFASGSSEIGNHASSILGRLAAVLKKFPNALRIEGYTDNKPIHTLAYPSNWELSAARAASVVHLFQDQGVQPGQMTVAGFGQYRPAVPNDSPEGRNRNRRVIVVIQAPTGSAVAAGLSAAADPAKTPAAAQKSTAESAAPAASAPSAPSAPSAGPTRPATAPPGIATAPLAAAPAVAARAIVAPAGVSPAASQSAPRSASQYASQPAAPSAVPPQAGRPAAVRTPPHTGESQ